MRKLSVYLTVPLGIVLLPALFMAQGAAAAPVVKPCQFGASGDGCIFDIRATASGTLTACTKAGRAGVRWRASAAQANIPMSATPVNAPTVQSNVGTESTTTFTGCITRPVVAGTQYEVLVTYERPLPGTFPTSVDVQFTGPVTVPNPRRRSGGPEEIQSCRQMSERAIAAVDVEPTNQWC
jgi:hypothetical protein